MKDLAFTVGAHMSVRSVTCWAIPKWGAGRQATSESIKQIAIVLKDSE